MPINISNLDENKDYIGLYLVNIKEGKSVNAFKAVLPSNIVQLFEGYDEDKNFNIYDLNNIIQAHNENCYAHYQNKKNCKNGWLYILDNNNQDYILTCIDRIKYIVRNWMLLYKENIEEEINKNSKEINLNKRNTYNLLSQESYIDDTIEQISLEPCVIDVTLESLSKNISIEKTLYLFYLREVLSGRLQITLDSSPQVGIKSDTLNFYGVNLLHNDATLRLMTRMTRPTVDENGIEYMYAYYVDITVQSYYGEKYPKLMIVPKSTRLRAENSILDKPRYFKTTSKKIYPYIYLPSTNRLSSSAQDGIFVQGCILNSTNPCWDKLFEKSFNYCFTDLPSVHDIFTAPKEYLYNKSNFDIYIPHGTHFESATHKVGTGVDVLKRISIADSVHSILLETECNIDDSIVITNKLGTSKMVNSIKTVNNNNFNLIQKDYFEFDLIYISDSFREIMTKFEYMYNSWNFDELDLSKKPHKSFKDACCSLRNILDGLKLNKPKDLGDIDTEPNIKLKVNFINQRSDLDLELAISKYAPENSDDRAKRKHMRSIEKAISNNKQKIARNIKTTANSCLVEVPSKTTYAINKQVDLKKSLKHSLSSIGKVSQVINYYEKTNNYSWGAVIFKCITELLRLEGYLLAKPSDIVSVYESKYKIDDTGENSLHIGVCYIQSFKYISLVAIYKGLVYGLDTRNNQKKWVPINQSCCSLGETIWTREMIKDNYSKYYLEEAVSSLYRQLTAINNSAVSHVFMYLDGSSLRKKLPCITHNIDNNFNLLLSNSYTDVQNILDEKSIMPLDLIDKMSICIIDGESSNYCPEWIEIKKGVVSPSNLPSAFCQLNESVFFSISEKTNTSNMGTNIKKKKDENADLSFRKESAIMISVLKNKEGYPKPLIATYAHLLKSKVSIQYSGLSDAAMVNPLPLDLAKKNQEHLHLKEELLLGSLDEDENMYEEESCDEIEDISSENEQLNFLSVFDNLFDVI